MNHSQAFFSEQFSYVFLLHKYIGIKGLNWFTEEVKNPDLWFSVKHQKTKRCGLTDMIVNNGNWGIWFDREIKVKIFLYLVLI